MICTDTNVLRYFCEAIQQNAACATEGNSARKLAA
jgi:hypothetical protein